MIDSTVIKFGGACFETTEDYAEAARIVVERAQIVGRVVVVVSAMHNCTALLQNALDVVNRHASPYVAAQLLATGDLQSAALLTAAVSAEGMTARLLPSHHTGLVGTGPALRSQLVSCDVEYLRTMTQHNRVVVLPGGQATGDHGMVVMLGRNSSDLTAVCVAAAVGSRSCQIISGVPGIHTADPAIVPNPRLIDTIDYQTVLEIGRSGARVLHPQAVRMARVNRIEIRCAGHPPTLLAGTVVGPFGGSSESIVVAATSSEVWRINGTRNLRKIETDLEREFIEPLLIVRDSESFVVVPNGFYAPMTDRICSGRGTRTDLRLLSLIRPGQEPERMLVPSASLVQEARRCHKRS